MNKQALKLAQELTTELLSEITHYVIYPGIVGAVILERWQSRLDTIRIELLEVDDEKTNS